MTDTLKTHQEQPPIVVTTESAFETFNNEIITPDAATPRTSTSIDPNLNLRPSFVPPENERSTDLKPADYAFNTSRRRSSSGPANKARRRSSLESVPFVGAYFAQRRLSDTVLSEYNFFAMRNMKVMYRSFIANKHLLPYEIAYFCKAMALPISVGKSPKPSTRGKLSLSGATANLFSNITKADGNVVGNYEGSSYLDISRETFLKYWEATIDAIEEVALNPSAIEEDDDFNDKFFEEEYSGVGTVKLSSREKKALRKHIQSPYVFGLLYGISKLLEKDNYAMKVIEPSVVMEERTDIYAQYGLSSIDQEGHDQDVTGTAAAYAKGVFFDIALLHFLAMYYSSLSSHVLSAESLSPSPSGTSGTGLTHQNSTTTGSDSLSPTSPTTTSSITTYSDLESLLPPLAESYGKIRLTPSSRCFNFRGIVSTYGAVKEARSAHAAEYYEMGLVPIVPVMQQIEPPENGKEIWDGPLVSAEGAFRKSKNLWKFVGN